MAKILIADLQEYKTGYQKNYESYKSLYNRNEHSRARRMLLTYGDECGLKYLVLKQWQIMNYSDIAMIIMDKSNPRHDIITTHNLEKIIKELGQAGMSHFPTKLKTTREVPINVENFHQYCRYGVRPAGELYSEELAFEKVLQDIAEWIKERICVEGL